MCCLVKCGETICGFLWTFGDQFVYFSFWQNGNTGSTGERTKRASEQATNGADIDPTTTLCCRNISNDMLIKMGRGGIVDSFRFGEKKIKFE